MLSIGHKETAGIAKQIAEMKVAIIERLHNAIELVGRPGATVPSTQEAITLVAAAFADIASLQVGQTLEAEMVLHRLDGGTLYDVKASLLDHLVATTRNMSAPSATAPDGSSFPVGALSRHYQEQLADTFSQAILSIDTVIQTTEFIAGIKGMFGDNVVIFGADEPEVDEDRGNVPSHIERSPMFYTTSDGQSPRAG